MDYDGLLELVKQRRSIRKFKPEPVPDEYVKKIIEAGRWISAVKPVINKWVADWEAKGKPAQQALDIAREECQRRDVPFPY